MTTIHNTFTGFYCLKAVAADGGPDYHDDDDDANTHAAETFCVVAHAMYTNSGVAVPHSRRHKMCVVRVETGMSMAARLARLETFSTCRGGDGVVL